MKLSRYSIIGIMVALLLTAMAIMPVFGAVAGTVTTDKSYVKAGGTVVVTVVDADLNLPTPKTGSVTAADTNWETGTTQYFSLADTQGQDGTGGTNTDFGFTGDEITGVVTVSAIDDGGSAVTVTQDWVVSIVNPKTGRIGILYVGSGDLSTGAAPVLGLSYSVSTKNTTSVLVTSPSDPTPGITVTLTESSADSSTYVGSFGVTNTASVSATSIQAVAGQSVTIKYTDNESVKRSATVVVESTLPVGSLVSPANNSYTTDLTPTLSVDFTDSDSGVVAGTSYKFTIVSVVTTDPAQLASGLTAEDQQASTEAITNGHRGTYTLKASPDAHTTTITWFATATDNAGNVGRTDADPSTSAADDYVLTIDRQGPKFTTATAYVGRWWDEVAESVVTDATKASNTTIAIEFPDTNSLLEQLDAATLIPADFRIDGLKDASGAVLSTLVPSAVNVYAKAANYAFLTVAPMASDASPTAITLTGAISDVTGNSTATGIVGTIADKIAPKLTYTLNKSLDADQVTITITSDEPLQTSAPSVSVDDGDGTVTVATMTLVATLKWEATLDPTGSGVWAVEVSAKDIPGNISTLGNSLNTTDFPTSKSIVFYTDGALPAATLVPDTGDEVTTANPFFLTIDHSAEAKEYGLDSQNTPRLSTITSHATANLNIATNLDTSALVTITAATLDGVDILSKFETQNNLNFTAAITDITIGDHVLVYSATDEAGNKVTGRTATFTVKARQAYKVGMNAGWNLISLPGAPKDPSLDSVFPVAHPATDVLTFEDGVWLVATRVSGGAWEGTLTTIDEKHGYWVNTTSSQPVSTLLNLTSVGAAATLPTIEINAGWNLISVIDLAQLAQGTADNTRKPNDDGTDTDDLRVGSDYLTSVSWSVAYTYDSSNRRWNRVTPTAGLLGNGQGVWVWAIKAGTLIP